MDKYGIYYDTIFLDDAYLAASPVPDDAVTLLHCVPVAPHQVHEVVSIDIVPTKTILVDAADVNIIGTITPYDYSAAADGTDILTGGAGAAGDLKTITLDLKVPYRLFDGKCILENGDSLRAILSVVTPTTAGVGYYYVVGYRITEYNGDPN